jgi:hypothetical protein
MSTWMPNPFKWVRRDSVKFETSPRPKTGIIEQLPQRWKPSGGFIPITAAGLRCPKA